MKNVKTLITKFYVQKDTKKSFRSKKKERIGRTKQTRVESSGCIRGKKGVMSAQREDR